MPRSYAVLIVALLALSACKPQKPKLIETAMPVQVMTVQQGDMVRTLNAVGTVRFIKEIPLGFSAQGSVATVLFKEGDIVQRGALLAVVQSSRSVEEVVTGASAVGPANPKAIAEFEKIRQLYAQGFVTKKRFEAAQAAARASTGAPPLTSVRTRTIADRSELRAPTAGIVITRFVQPGQIVGSGSPALLLGDTAGGLIFRAPLMDPDAGRLKVGMPVEVTIEALGSVPVKTNIAKVDGGPNQLAGAMSIEVRLPANPKLRPGTIGAMIIKLPVETGGSVQVPLAALYSASARDALVYLVDSKTGRVETRSVGIQRIDGELALVSGGLKPGDVIVLSDKQKLKSGTKVRILASPPLEPTKKEKING